MSNVSQTVDMLRRIEEQFAELGVELEPRESSFGQNHRGNNCFSYTRSASGPDALLRFKASIEYAHEERPKLTNVVITLNTRRLSPFMELSFDTERGWELYARDKVSGSFDASTGDEQWVLESIRRIILIFKSSSPSHSA